MLDDIMSLSKNNKINCICIPGISDFISSKIASITRVLCFGLRVINMK